MHTERPLYTLDEDTQSLLEEVLQLAQRVVDLQYDDETAEDLQLLLTECADRFGIRQTEVEVSDDGAGTITVTLLNPDEPKPKKKPTLTVVSSRDLDDTPPDDDDFKH